CCDLRGSCPVDDRHVLERELTGRAGESFRVPRMKLRRRPTHVIFDLDGVLLDTEPLYTRATQEIVGEYGKVFDWSVKADMIGRSAIDGARYMIAALEVPIAPEEYLRRRKPILDALFPTAEEIRGARSFV